MPKFAVEFGIVMPVEEFNSMDSALLTYKIFFEIVVRSRLKLRLRTHTHFIWISLCTNCKEISLLSEDLPSLSAKTHVGVAKFSVHASGSNP